jgi:hypothetical protein
MGDHRPGTILPAQTDCKGSPDFPAAGLANLINILIVFGSEPNPCGQMFYLVFNMWRVPVPGLPQGSPPALPAHLYCASLMDALPSTF